MHAIEKFIDAMTRSWWLTAAVFVWLGLFWFPLLDQLASLMDRLRGQCVQCGRLRSIHVDATMRYRDFCDEIGLTRKKWRGARCRCMRSGRRQHLTWKSMNALMIGTRENEFLRG